jgi:hypothetical protein
MKDYELKTSTGVVIWQGTSGEDAARRWTLSHPGETVTAYRNYPRVGIFLVHPSQVVG